MSEAVSSSLIVSKTALPDKEHGFYEFFLPSYARIVIRCLMTVFFDIDDTMMDHQGAERLGALDWRERYASLFRQTDPEFITLWREVMQKHFDRYLAGEISWQGQRRARMQELFASTGQDLSDEEADVRFTFYLERYHANWSLFPDVTSCLAAFERQDVGIISNGDSSHQRLKLERLGITGRFPMILISGDINIAKPRAEIFHEACRRVGEKPAHCFYVGDQLETDALGAHNAGLHGVWLDRTGQTSDHPEIPVIQSLAELPGLVNEA